MKESLELFNKLEKEGNLMRVKKLLSPYLASKNFRLYILKYKKEGSDTYDFFRYKHHENDEIENIFTLNENGVIDYNSKVINICVLNKYIKQLIKKV